MELSILPNQGFSLDVMNDRLSKKFFLYFLFISIVIASNSKRVLAEDTT